MKRGSIVSVIVPGDFGKPRPSLVIQSDDFQDTGTLTVLFLTTDLIDSPLFRIAIAPTSENGLQHPSHIMVDKVMSAKREKVGRTIGRVDDDTMVAVNRSLAVFLGIA